MTTVTLTATFPIVEEFRDYHDIDEFADNLNKVFNKRVRCAEVGFSGDYWGVFYVGRKPTKAVIKELLDKAGFEPMFDEDE